MNTWPSKTLAALPPFFFRYPDRKGIAFASIPGLIPIFERTDIADSTPVGAAIVTGICEELGDEVVGAEPGGEEEIGDEKDEPNPGVRNSAGSPAVPAMG